MSRTSLLSAIVLLGLSSVVLAQSETETRPAKNDAWRYDAVGRLMRNHDGGKSAPPYVLVDKNGKPRCYVTSDDKVALADFVNLRVGIRGTVNPSEGDGLPRIEARAVRKVQELQAATDKPGSEVVAAGHVEKAAMREELPVPQPDPAFSGTTTTMDGGTIVDGGTMQMQPGGVPYGEPGALMHGHDGCGQGQCGHDACPGESCPACVVCCMANDPGCWWVRAEYLSWQTSGMYIPPLVTTGPDAENPGILGEPGTEILYGDETINNAMRSGGRISFGRWLDCSQTWGIGGEYFALDDENSNFFAESDDEGSPIISRPFFSVFSFDDEGDPVAAQEDAELVSLPDVLAGSVEVDSTTSFQGAGAYLRYNFCCKNMCWPECFACCDPCDPCRSCSGTPGGLRVGMIGGYRFYRLRDSVNITENLTSLDEEFPGTFVVNDRFSTSNQFSGGEVGMVVDARKARWTLELMGRIAVGSNRQSVNINGSTVIDGSDDGSDGTYEGGLLALPTNIGKYNRSIFNVVPQLNANLGYNLSPRLKVMVGYTLIYWSSVARAGDQISLDVNQTYIPRAFEEPEGPARPAFAWRDTDFWAQGINLGLDYRF